MVRGMKMICVKCNDTCLGDFRDTEALHVQRIVHVINIALMECMGDVQSNNIRIQILQTNVMQ